jgi:phage terminase small subunit
MLTPKQHAFVHAYLTNGFNATQAAISAGYSVHKAQEQGSRLLSNVMVQEAIGAF